MADETARLAERVAEIASQRGLSVGAGESLTGGTITSALAAAPQAGSWCRGGVVAYMPTVKFDLLGVEPGPLISDRCAAQMARGTARVLEADVTVSTTGAGGPGEEEGHPAGTAVVGLCVRGSVTTHWLHLDGEPPEIVDGVRVRALRLLLLALGELPGELAGESSEERAPS